MAIEPGPGPGPGLGLRFGYGRQGSVVTVHGEGLSDLDDLDSTVSQDHKQKPSAAGAAGGSVVVGGGGCEIELPIA